MFSFLLYIFHLATVFDLHVWINLVAGSWEYVGTYCYSIEGLC